MGLENYYDTLSEGYIHSSCITPKTDLFQQSNFKSHAELDLKLQNALSNYVSGNAFDPVLIVDDVWTTGTSFREFTEIQLIKNDIEQNGWFGWCIFARTMTDSKVAALFQMPSAPAATW